MPVAAPPVFKCSGYRYSISTFVLALVQYLFTQTGLTIKHIQISDQLLPTTCDRHSPFSYECTLTHERSPLVTIEALIITILLSIPLLTIDVHLHFIQKRKRGT